LISDEKSSVYTRCGRTDKGVSALVNVCSLYVRDLSSGADSNGGYCHMMNRVLPPDIRFLKFARVEPHFDSRFSCIFREYKYFFCQGNMNMEKIGQVCKALIGTHDFRNFCKKDTSIVTIADLKQSYSANK
jgi:tRNA pseudouridine38/39 synthase